MLDMWGRELNCGDFVMILNQTLYSPYSNSIDRETTTGFYALVVSDTSVYDGSGLKQCSYLYKIESPITDELNEYNKLVTLYRKYVQEKNEKRKKRTQELKEVNLDNIQRGDIVYSNDKKYNKYLYLGKVEIREHILDTKSLIVSEGHCYIPVLLSKENKNKEVISSNDDFILFIKNYMDSFSNLYYYKDCSTQKSNLGLEGFKCLKKKTPVLSNKVKHLDILSDSFEIEMYYGYHVYGQSRKKVVVEFKLL